MPRSKVATRANAYEWPSEVLAGAGASQRLAAFGARSACLPARSAPRARPRPALASERAPRGPPPHRRRGRRRAPGRACSPAGPVRARAAPARSAARVRAGPAPASERPPPLRRRRRAWLRLLARGPRPGACHPGPLGGPRARGPRPSPRSGPRPPFRE
eukprot:tig00021493_g21861.t1